MPNLKRSRGKSVMDTDPTAVWVDPSAFKCVLYQDIEFEWKHISEPRFMSLDIIRSGIKCENFILKYTVHRNEAHSQNGTKEPHLRI
eukprot:437476_1